MEIVATHHEVIVQSGKYFLGDPCYAVPDELWHDLLESCSFFNTPIGTAGKHKVLGFGTAYGDGEYTDQYGNEFPVDAGLIGLVPEELVDTEHLKQYGDLPGLWVTFNGPTKCKSDGKVLVFGKHRIDTDSDD